MKGLVLVAPERVAGIGCEMRLRLFLGTYHVEFNGAGDGWRTACAGPGTPESAFATRERAKAYMQRVRS